MKIVLHKNATTTPSQRAFIQSARDRSNAELARELGVSTTTIRRWKSRDDILDRSHKPLNIRKTLKPEHELTAVTIRLILLSGLDDLLTIVRTFIHPDCSRSGLDRCLRHYQVSRLNTLLPDKGRLKSASSSYPHGHMVYHRYRILPQALNEQSDAVHIAMDCLTRYVYLDIINKQDENTTLLFLEKVKRLNPVKIEAVHHISIHETVAYQEMRKTFQRCCSEAFSQYLFNFKNNILKYVTIYNRDLPQRALNNMTPHEKRKKVEYGIL